MVGFYQKLIPHFPDIVFPLTEKIKNNPKATTLIFNTQEFEAFNTIKQKLAEVSTLPYPDSSCTNYHSVLDSSAYAIGVALHQIIDEIPAPIIFFLKKMTEPQWSLYTFDRELSAIYLVLHFKPKVEGCHITLFTDHKHLIGAYKKQTSLKSEILKWYLSIISEYVVDVIHIKGNENIVADCLSRPTNSHGRHFWFT